MYNWYQLVGTQLASCEGSTVVMPIDSPILVGSAGDTHESHVLELMGMHGKTLGMFKDSVFFLGGGLKRQNLLPQQNTLIKIIVVKDLRLMLGGSSHFVSS